ncbi:hypothetical protein BVY02_01230 [bacterium J17]|nr:hypothetical protein BVY02_01230 [bacterium J17]
MFADRPAYIITHRSPRDSADYVYQKVEEVLAAGGSRIAIVQLREPASDFELSKVELLELGSALRVLCHKYGTRLVVNRRVDLALKIEADGIHLGADHSISLVEARRSLGRESIVGFSAHSKSEVEAAILGGASYVILSPIFSPLSKQSTRAVLGLEYLRDVCASAGLEILALGGVTSDNVRDCRKAGASGFAAISSVFLSESPGSAINDLLKAWDG